MMELLDLGQDIVILIGRLLLKGKDLKCLIPFKTECEIISTSPPSDGNFQMDRPITNDSKGWSYQQLLVPK